jgi:tetratricopeptide (TPR) repeat protein
MTDPLRSDAASETAGRDHGPLVEELLLSGLEHYFAGEYELAINVWTRVLFLDRGHARARAYIERARSAVAERQREGEELVHTGAAAFARGESQAARRLLMSAVERGAATDEALALLARLDRLEAAGVQQMSRTDRRTGTDRGTPVARARDPRRARMIWIAAGAAVGIVAGGLAIAALAVRGGWLVPTSTSHPSTPIARPADELLIVPSTADIAIASARTLSAKGRLHEALATLDTVRPWDPLRPQADTLRGTIQAQLLAVTRAGEERLAPSRRPGTASK